MAWVPSVAPSTATTTSKLTWVGMCSRASSSRWSRSRRLKVGTMMLTEGCMEACSELAYNAGWDAGHDRAWWDVVRHDAARGNHGVVPNGGALENDRSVAEPDTILDHDGRAL